MAELNTITDPNLPEPKNISGQAEGKIYISDGSGSGTWEFVPSGWASYVHNSTGQNITTTPTVLLIDGNATLSNSAHLPFEIRGSAELWDGVNNKITPITVGDSYTVRLTLPITAKTGSPTEMYAELDIGNSTYANATVVYSTYAAVGRSAPYTISFDMSIFSLATFLANGGKFWLYTDSGSLTLGAPSILITRTSSGSL